MLLLKQHFFLLTLTSLLLASSHLADDVATSQQQHCSKDNPESCANTQDNDEKSKYTKEKNTDKPIEENKKWNKYLKKINKALKEYQECESSNCSCYNSQIEEDLKPWKKDGINAKLIKEAASVNRMAHYQIIDHKLYRSSDAMFPAR
jgi:hypothetical protein